MNHDAGPAPKQPKFGAAFQPVAGVTGRFAPTPSGRMHLGNVYAMLAAWLSAKSQVNPLTGEPGRVLLRIEDVDTARAVRNADRWLMDDLDWLGLDWSGEPVYQSRREDVYEAALNSLRQLDLQDAARSFAARSFQLPLIYPCFCSRADLRAASAPQEGDGFAVYPGTCRRLLVEDPGEVQARLGRAQRHAWRIAVPPASPAPVAAFDDRVFGPQRFNLASNVGDAIIRRSDGVFSYQLAVVVDDLLMGVNDVVRGRDLLRSTALQMWIRQALVASGFAAKIRQTPALANSRSASPLHPAYAHLPLVDDRSGVRLAKRKNSTDLGELRASGVAPEQVIGYCVWLLGLTKDEQAGPTAMSASEALQRFSWNKVRRNKTDHKLSGDIREEILSIR